jgi:hypothetical protein
MKPLLTLSMLYCLLAPTAPEYRRCPPGYVAESCNVDLSCSRIGTEFVCLCCLAHEGRRHVYRSVCRNLEAVAPRC